MELLTHELPSGYNYSFKSLHIEPMKFSTILEYLESLPDSPVERFYFYYVLVKEDDPKVDNLLLCDLDYVVFAKKCLTINRELNITTEATCPSCKSLIPVRIITTSFQFTKLSDAAIAGYSVELDGNYYNVRMPTVDEFMWVFANYRRMKHVTDLSIIKYVALFEDVRRNLKRSENLVIRAMYEDISVFVTLSQIYFRTVEPIWVKCPECEENFERLKYLEMESIRAGNDLDMEERLKELQESNYGGIAIGVNDLIVNFFRDILNNNRIANHKIIPREIRKDEQSGELHNDLHP